MGKKDKFEGHKDESFNRAHGRRDNEPSKTKQDDTKRERNVAAKGSEEHSRVAKGKRG
ncbi:MAG: hypothetical protein JWN89_41 [Parcubacteria group bacterium]|nr:hypothetical protein [Parcubacteria group bacterium]